MAKEYNKDSKLTILRKRAKKLGISFEGLTKQALLLKLKEAHSKNNESSKTSPTEIVSPILKHTSDSINKSGQSLRDLHIPSKRLWSFNELNIDNIKRTFNELDEDSTLLNTTFEISPGESSIFAPDCSFKVANSKNKVSQKSYTSQNSSTPLILQTENSSKRKRTSKINNKILSNERAVILKMQTRENKVQLKKQPNHILASLDQNSLIKNANTPEKVKESSKVFREALLESLNDMVNSKKNEITKKVQAIVKGDLDVIRQLSSQKNKMSSNTHIFSKIHQNHFQKMENIADYQARKEAKVDQYKDIWKRDNMLKRNTPVLNGIKQKANARLRNKQMPNFENPLPLPDKNVALNFNFVAPIFGQLPPMFSKCKPAYPTRLSKLMGNNNSKSNHSTKLPISKKRGSSIITSKHSSLANVNPIPVSSGRPMFKFEPAPIGGPLPKLKQKVQGPPSNSIFTNISQAGSIAKVFATPHLKPKAIIERIPEGSALKKRLAYDPKTSLRLRSRPTYKLYDGPVRPLRKSPKQACIHEHAVIDEIGENNGNIIDNDEKAKLPKRTRGRPRKIQRQGLTIDNDINNNNPIEEKLGYLNSVAFKITRKRC